MELLQQTENRGYPTEYLTSRIRGRSSYFIRNWDNLLYSPDHLEDLKRTRYGKFMDEHAKEGAWKQFLSETRWLYYQMNNGLQAIFRPFIMYVELKTLLICFRYKLSKVTAEELTSLLYFSLLSNKIKRMIVEAADLTSVLDMFEKYHISPPPDMSGLNEIFLQGGLKDLEERLRAVFIQGIIESRPHAVLRDFFTYITDSINLVSAFKYLRWNVESKPFFINGGSINLVALGKCISDNNKTGVNKFIYRLTGEAIEEVSASGLENILQTVLTKRLNRTRIRSGDIGLILTYMWKCYIEARNISIIMYGSDIDENALKEQLISGNW